MTDKQRRLLRFIERFQAEHDGVSPSIDEIGAGVGLKSRGGVHRLLTALQAAGVIQRRANAARSIRIVGLPPVLAAMSDDALLAEVARRGLCRTYDGWSA